MAHYHWESVEQNEEEEICKDVPSGARLRATLMSAGITGCAAMLVEGWSSGRLLLLTPTSSLWQVGSIAAKTFSQSGT